MKKFYFTLCCLFIVGALFTLTGCHNCNYSQYKVVKEATCTEEGSKIRYCKDDSSHSETQVIPALGI